MKTKANVSVGIDGISCNVSGCSIQKEMKFPEDSDEPFLRLKPKGTSTEIALILPRTIRETNNIGFRITDTRHLNDVIQKVNRALKQIIKRDLCELFVNQIEIACSVDLGTVDKLTVDSAMNFISRVMLDVDRPNKEAKKPNAVRTKPVMKYSTGEVRKDCVFIKEEVAKSMETSLWSNRRLKWKAYSKGAFSEFGGNTSIYRIEGVYVERGVRQVLKNQYGYITLPDILKQSVIRKFISQFKLDYMEIISPKIRGFLNEAEKLVYETLENASAYNSLLIQKDVIYDMRIYRRALKKYYKTHNKSEGAYRKMLCSVTKRMRKEGICISDKVIALFESISDAVRT